MELVRGLESLKPRHRGAVASIGNFDGVHLGHQAVLKQLTAKARELKLPATVIVFEPMPLEYFSRGQPPARLTRFGEKWRLLAQAGVERLLCLRFDRKLAEMPAESFIERVLVQGLQVRYLAVGDDFRFGKGRLGNYELLKQAGATHGFEVTDSASLILDGERVSSTRIRSLLIDGDMPGAARLLGRPYSLSGRVMHGERLGSKLGFPTANLALRRKLTPVGGIFAARVKGLGPEPRDAAAYVGVRPALGGTLPVLETHLMDFSGDLYGRMLTVELLAHLREDRHFDSLDALSAQMQQDVRAASRWLAEHRT
ncbi:MAG TPA: bifunctional riboflavin kinase/FAD synthetase [Gammaproteobacteria bacterium]|nr:bifunctional riboflavin kinase/FAD synthetase [Gammaproteobacteria bacterium]